MKKVLLLFDGANFQENTVSFVQQMHLLSPLTVAALFAPAVLFPNLWSYAGAGETGAATPDLLEADEETKVLEHMHHFEQLCARSNIPCRVHRPAHDLALPALHRESRFADLLLLSGSTFDNEILFTSPAHYIHKALHEAECPVLILPDAPAFPTEVLVAYDGSRDSVFSLKQFAYLFPEWAQLKTMIVHSGAGAAELPEKLLVSELVDAHYNNVQYQKLAHTGRAALRKWIEKKPHALVVTGSFSRGWLSGLFGDSFSADLVAHHRIPVFIAHR